MNYYKPCSVDVESDTFITRSILIRYQGEEASMRDSCCWRIEVPFDVIDDASLTFNVDLYFHQPIKSDNRVIAYAEKPTVCDETVLYLVHWFPVHSGFSCE